MTELWSRWRQRVEEAVDRAVPEQAYPRPLWEAMRYTALGGGKRLRGTLVLAGAVAIADPAASEGITSLAIPAAVAVELVHAYSLIHDDLPILDNDDWRRGKPTNHKRFGAAMALLAGDALLAHAFAVLTQSPGLDERSDALPRGETAETLQQLQWMWVQELSRAAGPAALVGGQALDWELEHRGGQMTAAERAGTLEYVHRHKTGALIQASIRMGGFAGLTPAARRQAEEQESLVRLSVYGAELGLAFQITDDLLDEVGDPARTGKAVGRDRAQGKVTYVSVYGIQEARLAASRALARAQEAIASLGEPARPLVELAQELIQREN